MILLVYAVSMVTLCYDYTLLEGVMVTFAQTYPFSSLPTLYLVDDDDSFEFLVTVIVYYQSSES